MRRPIALLVSDPSVLSSLQFTLPIEGFELAAAGNLAAASALVIDQSHLGDGLASLLALRARGCAVAAIMLATNPSASFRDSVARAGAILIEKPLLGDELSSAINGALEPRKAA